MNRNFLIALAVVGLLVILYFAMSNRTQPATELVDTQTPEAQLEGVVMVDLSEQNASGESGTAVLVEEDGQVIVSLAMEGFPTDVPQPAHIHTGACPDVGGVVYPLTNVVNGESVTTLDVTLAQLTSELPLGINVHKSAAEASVYTACGDLEL